MGELKSGWKRVKLGEIIERHVERVEDGTTYSRFVGVDDLDTGDLRLRRHGTIGVDEIPPTFKYVFRAGMILLPTRRPRLRKCAVAPFDGLTGEKILVLKPKVGSGLHPMFAPYLLSSPRVQDWNIESQIGSVTPHFRWGDTSECEVALPPLGEQERIVERLQTQQEVVEAILAAHAASGGALRSLQKKWFMVHDVGVLTEIGSVAMVLNGTTPRRSESAYWNGAIPWLPTSKVNDRIIRTADEFITKRALDETALSIIPSGATLVAMIGEGQTRGRVAMLEVNACINQNFGAIVPGPKLDPWFLFYQLDFLYEALRRWSHGTNQQALNCSLLRSFRIRVPPIDQQREMVGAFRQVEASREELERRCAAAKTMLRDSHEGMLV
jgi:type I restriction enzyme S subunit